MSFAYLCEVCGIEPMWHITRIGDVVTTWACPRHLSQVCESKQRDPELTQLNVVLYAKEAEWSSVTKELNRVMETAHLPYPRHPYPREEPE